MDKREAIAKITSKMQDIKKGEVECLYKDPTKEHIKLLIETVDQIIKIMNENNIKLTDLSKSLRNEFIRACRYGSIPSKYLK